MADRHTVVVEACDIHPPFNDPEVRGIDWVQMNGRRVVPRIANATLSIGADGTPLIETRWAAAAPGGGRRRGAPCSRMPPRPRSPAMTAPAAPRRHPSPGA